MVDLCKAGLYNCIQIYRNAIRTSAVIFQSVPGSMRYRRYI